MSKDKKGLFKSAKDYENRKVNYNDDYNLFKNRRMVLIEIYKYGPYERLKVKRLVDNINVFSENIMNSRNRNLGNFINIDLELLGEALADEHKASLEVENKEENE
tara:strand:+ start:4478 stop:4792 length:315 start_codon:yes stop_codon:yes gene_type:complete